MVIWKLSLPINVFIFRIGVIDESFHKQCLKKVAEFFSIATDGKNRSVKQWMVVSWQKHPRGWVKLNTDGLSLGNLGQASSGGLLRDEDGEWIKGCARNCGNLSSIMAEL